MVKFGVMDAATVNGETADGVALLEPQGCAMLGEKLLRSGVKKKP